MRKRHIKTRSFPRVGLVGNPSDGYFGRTIAFTFKNFNSEILLGEDSTRISFVNRESEFDSVEDLCDHIQLHGYYGCLLYTSPSPRDGLLSRMPSSA